jgi:hypothetical protein
MEKKSRLIAMAIQPVIEPNIVERTSDHWEIVSANYENGEFHIEFKDGTKGTVAVNQFPALANATDVDFEALQVILFLYKDRA